MFRHILILFVLPAVLAAAGCQPQHRGTYIGETGSLQRQPWQGPDGAGELYATDHYRIYTTSQKSSLLSVLPGFMEAAHQNYLSLTGLSDLPAGQALPIYLFATRGEWTQMTRSLVGPAAEVYMQIEAGGYCYNGVCVFWNIGGLGTLSTASHEGLHQFLHKRMKNNLPMWAEEGLCATAEGFEIAEQTVTFLPEHNPARYNNLRAALSHQRRTPIQTLLSMDAGDAVSGHTTETAVGYYGQLWGLIRFLRSQPEYRQRFQRMLNDAAEGRFAQELGMSEQELSRLQGRGRAYNKAMSEPLFRHYISDDLEAFDRQYQAYIMGLCGL